MAFANTRWFYGFYKEYLKMKRLSRGIPSFKKLSNGKLANPNGSDAFIFYDFIVTSRDRRRNLSGLPFTFTKVSTDLAPII